MANGPVLRGRIVGTKFLVSFASESGKLLASKVWKNRTNYTDAVQQPEAEPLRALVETLNEIRDQGKTTTIAVDIEHEDRNAGLVVTAADPETVIWQLACVLIATKEIQEHVAENKVFADFKNPDLSIRLEVKENGEVLVQDTELPSTDNADGQV